MKTTLIGVSIDEDSYFLGIGIGFEKGEHESFFGLVIVFLIWTIRIGIDRSLE